MYDILFLGNDNDNWKLVKERFPLAIRVSNAVTFSDISKKSFTKLFWLIWDDVVIEDEFDLVNFKVEEWDQRYIHVFKHNGKHITAGVCLFPKSADVSNRELSNRYFLEKKEIDIDASRSSFENYSVCTIDSYDDYLKVLEDDSVSEMFWYIPKEVTPLDSFKFDLHFDPFNRSCDFDREINHVFLNGEKYNGIILFSKQSKITKREFDHKFPINRKEWAIQASKPSGVISAYDFFFIDTYEEYTEALSVSLTDMFWGVSRKVKICDEFKFDIQVGDLDSHDLLVNHAFLHRENNVDSYTGVFLFNKNVPLSKREIEHRFPVNRKEWNIQASEPFLYNQFKSLYLYDIIFISYNEPNADDNWKDLKSRFPRAKRVHGVKGIHNAHIAAANLASTNMFWVVDGDAKITDDFDFTYQLKEYDEEVVHVWKSKNPVNGLIYGYGGVKLLPRQLTIAMDVNSTDMTTSISEKFKSMDSVSNITVFDTDAFSTWRSAFRECVKLSSGSILKEDSDTLSRLNIWCTVGQETLYGKYCIDGANAGREYGSNNKGNTEALLRINDFAWLSQQFNNAYNL